MGNAIAYFTPALGIAGGATIGISAAALLLLSGDILGASGIINTLFLTPHQAVNDPCSAWKLVFLSAFGLFSSLVLGRYFAEDERLGQDASVPVVSTYGYLLSGLFVGFGTRLGNGCTSGHGICGMARLSVRSITAVMTFMMTAFAVSAITAPQNKTFAKGTTWLRTDDAAPDLYNPAWGIGVTCIVAVLPSLVALFNLLHRKSQNDAEEPEATKQASSTPLATETFNDPRSVEATEVIDLEKNDKASSASHTSQDASQDHPQSPPSNNCALEEPQKSRDAVLKLFSGGLSGLLFALGLAVSGMVQPAKVLGFLNLYLFAVGTYDPTLLTVMISGCAVSFFAYQFVDGHAFFVNRFTRTKPILTSSFSVPCNKTIDWKLMVGAVCFGTGWALSGLCPGPAMFLAASGTKQVIFYYWPLFIVGSYAANFVREKF